MIRADSLLEYGREEQAHPSTVGQLKSSREQQAHPNTVGLR